MHVIPVSPFFASALQFAFEKATTEGKITIGVLLIVSVFSWSVIITKGRQLLRARKVGKKFFASYRQTKDPLDMARREFRRQFDGGLAIFGVDKDEVVGIDGTPICVSSRRGNPTEHDRDQQGVQNDGAKPTALRRHAGEDRRHHFPHRNLATVRR